MNLMKTAKFIVYSMKYCPYCESAKKLLKQEGYEYEEIMVADDDDKTWDWLEKKTGFKTMPQIFFGDKFIGGFNELNKLNQSGDLNEFISK